MKQVSIMLLSVILCGSLNAANEQNEGKSGKVVNQSDLHKAPKYKSAVIANLAVDDAVSVKQRSRAWYQISTETQTDGWVKMLNIRFVGVLKRQGELGVQDLFDSVVTRQVSTTQSTGIRGFDEEDLKNAKADLTQLAILSSYNVSSENAAAFAHQGKLRVNKSVDKIRNEFSNKE